MAGTWFLGMGIRLVSNQFATGMQQAGRTIRAEFAATDAALKSQADKVEKLRKASVDADRQVRAMARSLTEMRAARPRGADAVSDDFKAWERNVKAQRQQLDALKARQREAINEKAGARVAKDAAKAAMEPHVEALRNIGKEISKVRQQYKDLAAPSRETLKNMRQAMAAAGVVGRAAADKMKEVRESYEPRILRARAELNAAKGQGRAGAGAAARAAQELENLRISRDRDLHNIRQNPTLRSFAQAAAQTRPEMVKLRAEILASESMRDADLARLTDRRTSMLQDPAAVAAQRNYDQLRRRYRSADAAATDAAREVRNAQTALDDIKRAKPADGRSDARQRYESELRLAQEELNARRRTADLARQGLEDAKIELRDSRAATKERKRVRREELLEAQAERRRTMMSLTGELLAGFGMVKGAFRRIFGVSDRAAEFQYQARGLSAMLGRGRGGGEEMYADYARANKYQAEVSPTEAMARMRQLAAAGYSGAEIPGNVAAIFDTIGAAKGEITNEGAFQLGINLHRNFGGKYRSMRNLLDTAVMTSNRSPMTIGQVADASAYGIEAATQYGQTAESMLAAMGVLMPITKTASRAGTVYRNALASMVKPDNQKLLAEQGIRTTDANNRPRDMIEVMLDLNERLDALRDTNTNPKYRNRAAAIQAELDAIEKRRIYGSTPVNDEERKALREQKRQDRISKFELSKELEALKTRADITPTRQLREQLMFQFGGQRGGAIFAALHNMVTGSASNALEGTALQGTQFKDARAAWYALRSGMSNAAGESRRLADELRDTSKLIKGNFTAALERASIAVGEVTLPFVDASRRMGASGLSWIAEKLGGSQKPGEYAGPGAGSYAVAGVVGGILLSLSMGTISRFAQMAQIANARVAQTAADQGMSYGGGLSSWLGGKISGGADRLGDWLARKNTNLGNRIGLTVQGVGNFAGSAVGLLGPLVPIVGSLAFAMKAATDAALDYSKQIGQRGNRNVSAFMAQMQEMARGFLGETVDPNKFTGQGVVGGIGFQAYSDVKRGKYKGALAPVEAMQSSYDEFVKLMYKVSPKWMAENADQVREQWGGFKSTFMGDLAVRAAKTGNGAAVEELRAALQGEAFRTFANDPFMVLEGGDAGGAYGQLIKDYYKTRRSNRGGGPLNWMANQINDIWFKPYRQMIEARSPEMARFLTPDMARVIEQASPQEFEGIFNSFNKKFAPALPGELQQVTQLAGSLTQAVKDGNKDAAQVLSNKIDDLIRAITNSPLMPSTMTDTHGLSNFGRALFGVD